MDWMLFLVIYAWVALCVVIGLLSGYLLGKVEEYEARGSR